MKRILVALLVGSVLGFAGCGGNEGTKVEVPTNPQAPPPGGPAKSGDAGGANVAPKPPEVRPED